MVFFIIIIKINLDNVKQMFTKSELKDAVVDFLNSHSESLQSTNVEMFNKNNNIIFVSKTLYKTKEYFICFLINL